MQKKIFLLKLGLLKIDLVKYNTYLLDKHEINMPDIEELILQINKKHPEFCIEKLYEICDEFIDGEHKKNK